MPLKVQLRNKHTNNAMKWTNKDILVSTLHMFNLTRATTWPDATSPADTMKVRLTKTKKSSPQQKNNLMVALRRDMVVAVRLASSNLCLHRQGEIDSDDLKPKQSILAGTMEQFEF